MANRRRHERTQYISRTEVRWHTEKGEVTVPGIIEDKSASGPRIQVSKAIPIGTPVEVKFCNQMIAAVVRRCASAEVGVFLGVSLEPDQPDTAEERLRDAQSAIRAKCP